MTTLDPRKRELDHIGPVFLPDGRRFVCVARQAQGQLQAKWGSLDGKESGELPLQSALIQFVPPDYLLFRREGAVFAQKLDVLKRFGAVADSLAQVPRIQLARIDPADYNRGKFASF